MQEYFQSYRTSLRNECLNGFPEFSDSENLPNRKETFNSYITGVTTNLHSAVASNDYKSFKRWIKAHQKVYIELFKRMVSKNDNAFFDGYKSFKFSDTVIKFDRFILVPRIGLEPKHNELPIVYASEMNSALRLKRLDIAEAILEVKRSGKEYVILDGNTVVHSTKKDLNQGLVRDWAEELHL